MTSLLAFLMPASPLGPAPWPRTRFIHFGERPQPHRAGFRRLLEPVPYLGSCPSISPTPPSHY
jgi:hypothetical protein